MFFADVSVFVCVHSDRNDCMILVMEDIVYYPWEWGMFLFCRCVSGSWLAGLHADALKERVFESLWFMLPLLHCGSLHLASPLLFVRLPFWTSHAGKSLMDKKGPIPFWRQVATGSSSQIMHSIELSHTWVMLANPFPTNQPSYLILLCESGDCHPSDLLCDLQWPNSSSTAHSDWWEPFLLVTCSLCAQCWYCSYLCLLLGNSFQICLQK